MVRNRDRARWAALVALIGFAWWIVTVTVLHILADDGYDPVRQSISDLAVEPRGVLLNVGFLGLGAGGLALAIGLYWSVRGAVAAPILLGIVAVLWITLGIFQTDPDATVIGESDSTEALIHDAAAIASAVIVTGVMFLFAWRFRLDEVWDWFALPTLVWAFMAMAAFFLFPLLGEDRIGVAQRAHIAISLSWLVATAARLWSVASATRPSSIGSVND